jgi:hypothetical protein
LPGHPSSAIKDESSRFGFARSDSFLNKLGTTLHLQNATLRVFVFFFIQSVRPVGLEPTTNGLKGRCSTIELQAE